MYELIEIKNNRTILRGPLGKKIDKIKELPENSPKRNIKKDITELVNYIDPAHLLGKPEDFDYNFSTDTLFMYCPNHILKESKKRIEQYIDFKVLNNCDLSLQLSFRGIDRKIMDFMRVHQFITGKRYDIGKDEKHDAIINPITEGGFFIEGLKIISKQLHEDKYALEILMRKSSCYTPIDYKLFLLAIMMGDRE